MFRIFQENKDIKWLIQQKEYINFSPSYQRMGGIWNKRQKQMLIDSIINGFDIPKIYFDFMPRNDENVLKYNYAVIDGKQRLEAIYEFISDKYELADNVVIFNDKFNSNVNISGKKFSEIESIAPEIIAKMWQFELCFVFIDTDDVGIIDEMFVRLNSGVNVNTAEKRNANGGILSQEVRTFCTSSIFFNKKTRIDNKRYAHFDLALKLLMTEMQYNDLSKKSVDDFVVQFKDKKILWNDKLEEVKRKLNRISVEFEDKDEFLSRKNIIITLYSIIEDIPSGHMRNFLSWFENLRKKEINQDTRIVEFSRLLQQGADKQYSLTHRRDIMEEFLNEYLNTFN